MNEIEAEIRRQMLEERDRALQSQIPPPSVTPPTPNGSHYEASPPSTASSYHALPPPSFPQAGAPYPPQYPPSAYPPSAPAQPNPIRPLPPASPAASKSPRRKGLMGGLGAAGIALAKFWGAIKALLIGFKFLVYGKYLITAGSMLVSIAAWSALYGWRFGVGVVFLIFIHEMGHALAIKRLGQEVTAMVFVPFVGAYVQHQRVGTAAETAEIAIMGPVAGMLAGLACGAVYGMTGSAIWLALAWVSFFMNLFNLSAIPFLDGGRVAILIPSKLLLGGLIVIALINHQCPISWLMLLLAIPQIVEQWRFGTINPAIQISKNDQQIYTIAYFAMALFLGCASITTQNWIWDLRHLGRAY